MNIEYTNETLEAYYHEEGRINLSQYASNGTEQHEYSLKDHLGNARVQFTTDNNNDGSPDVLQENHYYPFGLNINPLSKSFSNPQNNYQYNGKELNTDFGLHWNDYGAR